jgi:hypothetical protein
MNPRWVGARSARPVGFGPADPTGTLVGVEDVAALIEAHACSKGICNKKTHQQVIELEAADVGTTRAEIATLVEVRDQLRAHGYQLLEGEPTPRFGPDEATAKPWTVKFEQLWGAPTPADPHRREPPRRGWLSRLWTPTA